MAYVIPLTPAGRAFYEQRDQDLERAVIYLIERIGVEQWRARAAAVHERYRAKLEARTTPDEGISVRDREDEMGWYLYLAETLIADPPAVDSDQANRVVPYLSALGRKLEAIQAIEGVEPVLARLTRELKNHDPDQVLFELLVGATYVQDGWTVRALETGSMKTPDFEIRKGLRRFEVECKRMARRSDYADRERDAWLQLWKPAAQWLVREKRSLIFTIRFYTELHTLPRDFLVRLVTSNAQEFDAGRGCTQEGIMTIGVERVDYERIHRELADSYVKRTSARERFVVTGRYERDYGLTYAIGGQCVVVGSADVAGKKYWDSIDYVNGAFWHCDAPAAIDAKARHILKRLSDATAQFTGRASGIVHLGIEADEDTVEVARALKIETSLPGFNPRGQPLEWLFLHYFRGESIPDGSWAIDETLDWRGAEGEFFRPLKSDFLVLPPTVSGREGRLFEPPRS